MCFCGWIGRSHVEERVVLVDWTSSSTNEHHPLRTAPCMYVALRALLGGGRRGARLSGFMWRTGNDEHCELSAPSSSHSCTVPTTPIPEDVTVSLPRFILAGSAVNLSVAETSFEERIIKAHRQEATTLPPGLVTLTISGRSTSCAQLTPDRTTSAHPRSHFNRNLSLERGAQARVDDRCKCAWGLVANSVYNSGP